MSQAHEKPREPEPGPEPGRPCDCGDAKPDTVKDPRAGDAFPSTQMSWIDSKMLEGEEGRAELNRHMMNVYAGPLKVYFLGSSFRGMGDAEDLIRGFFADRLWRPDFLDEWRRQRLERQARGQRFHLRYWLINALKFYLHEERRSEARARRVNLATPEEMEQAAVPEDLAKAFDRAFWVEVARKALERIREACRARGDEVQWTVLYRHGVLEEEYSAFCGELGLTPNQAAKLYQKAREPLRRAVLDLLADDGVRPEDMDEEIRGFLEDA